MRMLLVVLVALSSMQAPSEPRVLEVSRHEAGVVEFEAPADARGPFLGLSLDGSVSIELQNPPSPAPRPGSLRGVTTTASTERVLFVLWASQLPALAMRSARATAAGASLRIIVARASGPQTYFLGFEQGWDITQPKIVAASVFVDGTTGLTYLLASGDMGGPPCPSLAVLYDVTNELRLIGRRATCDA